MTTSSDLHAILAKLERKLNDSKRFQKQLAAQIKDNEKILQKLQKKSANWKNKR